jgi:hypothetical protein
MSETERRARQMLAGRDAPGCVKLLTRLGVEVRLRAQDRAELDAWATDTMGDDPRHAERAWYETTRATLEERTREAEAWQHAAFERLAELIGTEAARVALSLLDGWEQGPEELVTAAVALAEGRG